MGAAPHSEPTFRPLRRDFDVDLEAIVDLVPDTATTKGMFVNRALRLAPSEVDEEDVLTLAGAKLQRFIPFRDYAWTEFIRICAAVGELSVGEGRRSEGLRFVGHSFYPEFAESVAGKVVFGFLGRYADRVIPLGPKAWTMSATLGAITGESVGDRHYRYHFEGLPSDIVESLSVGIIEGALSFCGVEGEFLIKVLGPTKSVLDIRWSED